MLRNRSRQHFEELAEIFHQVEATGDLPQQREVTGIAVLPKKPTVERQIGLMHLCVKTLFKARWYVTEDWN